MNKFLFSGCAALLLASASCKKDSKNNDPLLQKWQLNYMAYDSDGNGTIEESEHMNFDAAPYTPPFSPRAGCFSSRKIIPIPAAMSGTGSSSPFILAFFPKRPVTLRPWTTTT